MMLWYLITVFCIIKLSVKCSVPSACEIFCQGEILHVVQTSGLFDDSNTFINMKMKRSKSEILFQFSLMMKNTNRKPHKLHVRRFIRKNFSPPGEEFKYWEPKDWVKKPGIVEKVSDPTLKKWVYDLNEIWKLLSRKIRPDVFDNLDLYSILYVPNPFIIPDSRRREYYYWDSYWIVLGLLHTDMYATAKGIIENLLYLVKQYGFVPNGGRIYLLDRSNVPLLIPMTKLYYNLTGDEMFLEKHIETLEKEFNFWMKHRLVEVSDGTETFKLARYGATATKGPRPENYVEDFMNASHFKTEKERVDFYQETKASCEAGWNDSSRWRSRNDGVGGVHGFITQSIIPVDLNAIIFLNAQILSEFYKTVENYDKAAYYKNVSETWKESVTKLLWSKKDGMWFDYDMTTNKSRKNFYISNVVPLWSGCYNESQTDEITENVIRYLEKNGIRKFRGGIPTSFMNTGLRWDFPNAIPASQHMLIVGLERTKNVKARELAYKLANKWIRTNYIGFKMMNNLFDTYDVRKPGVAALDRFRDIGVGCGWTNGVVLDLLYTYGKRVSVRDITRSASSKIPKIPLLILYIYFYLFRLAVINLPEHLTLDQNFVA